MSNPGVHCDGFSGAFVDWVKSPTVTWRTSRRTRLSKHKPRWNWKWSGRRQRAARSVVCTLEGIHRTQAEVRERLAHGLVTCGSLIDDVVAACRNTQREVTSHVAIALNTAMKQLDGQGEEMCVWLGQVVGMGPLPRYGFEAPAVHLPVGVLVLTTGGALAELEGSLLDGITLAEQPRRPQGRHVATVGLQNIIGNAGLAVSRDGTLMAVSNLQTDMVTVYGLPGGHEVARFGGSGSDHGQFDHPFGLCFTGDGCGLLVADHCNKRVQEFCQHAGLFVHKRTIGADTFTGCPVGIAADADVIVVSQEATTSDDDAVVVLDSRSGNVKSSLGWRVGRPFGLCVSPDGAHVWVACPRSRCVSMLSLVDGGEVARWSFADMELQGPTGVCVASNGDIVVADFSGVLVLSPTAAEMKTRFGKYGVLRCVAYAAGRVFVLDQYAPHVQVFE